MASLTMHEAGDLKRVGLKATLPRLHILAVFEEAEHHHLSAEAVYRRLKEQELDIGLATVYRVIAQLQSAGLLKPARFDEGKTYYELDDGQPHDHLICTDCGRIQELHDPRLEAGKRRIAQRLGFDLAGQSLVLYGCCDRPDCEHRSASPSRPPKSL